MTALAQLAPTEVSAPAHAREGPDPRELERLAAARAGDQASMRALYEAEGPRLLRRLRNLTGDPIAAQDLTHDVFVVAFSGRASFEGGSSLATWLYGIAANKLRNERRKSKRRREALRAEPQAELVSPSAADEAPALAEQAELQRALDRALARLSAPLREAFVLRVLEALPLREAAELAGVSLSTLSKRAAKAEAQVRAAFRAEPSDARAAGPRTEMPSQTPNQPEEKHR